MWNILVFEKGGCLGVEQYVRKTKFKNWFDFSEFKEYENKEYQSAIEQPQMWLQNILKNETNRKKLAELFRDEIQK